MRNSQHLYTPASAFIVLGLAAFHCVSAIAQSASSNLALEEIVVTAQKRAESLQDVPISITAFSADRLTRQRINTAEDMASVVPNLQINSSVGEGAPIFALRGISMVDFSFAQNGPVATYYDEVYKGNFAILGVALYDLERVEVLRGPQGTLYGKNTTGGAINLVSRKPDFTTGGYLSLGYGNYDRYEADGAIQTAFSDKIAGRLAFTFDRGDGWFDNVFPGAADPNDTRQYGIRGTIVIAASERLDITIRGSTSLQNPHNFGIFGEPLEAGVGGGVYELFGGESYFRRGLGHRELETSHVPRRRASTYAAAITADWKMTDDLTLTSVASYDRGTLRFVEDGDGSPLYVYEGSYLGRTTQIAEDLRIASNYDGPLNFLVGAYFNREEIFNETRFDFYNDIDVNGDSTIDAQDCIDGGGFLACRALNRFNQVKTSYASYFDVTFDVNESIQLRGGLRYTYDRGKLSDFMSQLTSVDDMIIANLIPGSPTDLFATTDARFSKSNVSGKVGVDYRFGDHLAYLSYGRGYRGNSFNASAIYDPAELGVAKPETIDAVELGFKGQVLDGRMQLNGAIFWYGYKDQQFLSNDPVTTVQILGNLPKAQIIGGELELVTRLSKDLQITGAIGLLDSEVRKGTLQGSDIKGNRLINAPSTTLSAAVDWTIPVQGDSFVLLHLDASYASKQYSDLLNKPILARDEYTLLNARAAYRFADDRYGIAVWGKNLTNKYYFNSRVDASGLGFIYSHLGEPRTYGITIDAKF